MKVKITYQKWENPHAQRIADFIQREFPGAKVRKSNAYPPFFHKIGRASCRERV